MFKLPVALDSKQFSSVNELLASKGLFTHFVRSFGLKDSQLAALKLHLHTVAYSSVIQDDAADYLHLHKAAKDMWAEKYIAKDYKV